MIDPDKWLIDDLRSTLAAIPAIVKSIIVGGSFLHSDNFEAAMKCCLDTQLPVGNIVSVSVGEALLSPAASYVLVPIVLTASSSQFVTQHLIRVVPLIRKYNVPVVPYAYLMLAGGKTTSAEFFTQTIAIPRNKPEILSTLSLTAEYLGLRGIYLEAGSGAEIPISLGELSAVKKACTLPVIVGGGLNSPKSCRDLFDAGASAIFVGTVIEKTKNISWLRDI